MDINCTEVLLHLLTNMGADLSLCVKAHEALALQKNIYLLSQLSAFDALLNNIYERSCPSPEDYANRRDLIRIFNEIAKEIYGNSDGCPVVEDFGSFLMDIFNARSDLDMSINFSDKLFEANRVTKIKTLRKFANKCNDLRKKGHVTTVKLILKARVPVLKVTDSGSGIECDFSVGNRDGISKSHIVLMISAIDERFKKLCILIKAWAKAHDINSAKDGTLNSLSLILLVAFHLQTRDIPILPPLSAIFKAGMDPFAVNRIPSFLNYGQRNKESLAELFISLLVQLESVKNSWSMGLCASTYEGSWVFKNWEEAGCIRIEDFSDRSQNTARAVGSAAQFDKNYSCIRHSLELIQAFTEGLLDAGMLMNLLFCAVPPKGEKVRTILNKSKPSKPVSLNPTQEKAKSSAQAGHPDGQRPIISKPVSPDHTRKKKCLVQLVPKPSESAPNSIQKKKRSVQVGPEGQRPGKKVKHNPCSSEVPKVSHNPCSSEAPKVSHNPCGLKASTPCKTDEVKKKMKKKSGTGMNTATQTSDPVTSFQVLNTQPDSHCRKALPLSNPPIQGLEGVTPSGKMNNETPTFQVAQSYSNRPAQSLGESGQQKASVGNLNDVPSSFPIRQCSLSKQPVEPYGGFRPQRTDVDTLNLSAPNFPAGPSLAVSNQHILSSGGFPLDQPLQHYNHLHLQGYGQFKSERSHVDSLRDAPPNFPVSPTYSLSNTSSLQMSGPFTSGPTSVTLSYQPNLFLFLIEIPQS